MTKKEYAQHVFIILIIVANVSIFFAYAIINGAMFSVNDNFISLFLNSLLNFILCSVIIAGLSTEWLKNHSIIMYTISFLLSFIISYFWTINFTSLSSMDIAFLVFRLISIISNWGLMIFFKSSQILDRCQLEIEKNLIEIEKGDNDGSK